MLIELTLIALGGFFGAIIRFSLGKLLNRKNNNDAYKSKATFIPYGTLTANTCACFIFGILGSLFHLDPHLKLIFITGFLGSLSTFSTFILEYVKMNRKNKLIAFSYLTITIILGTLSFSLGSLCINSTF